MSFAPLTPIAALLTDLDVGRTSASALLETALERAADPAGEGARVFVKMMAETARAHVAANFTVDLMVARTLQVYATLLGGALTGRGRSAS